MDYNGTRETESEVALGDAALARTLPELAAAASASARTGGIPLAPDAAGTVVLPDGASLDDITVRGRDLVIQLEDGRTYVIADGAIFVPQIVAQGVTVPPLNLAALLIGNEPEPAAGAVRSSGGNFAVPVGSIQDAYAIGDLLPYTELKFGEPRVREIFPVANRKPITGPNADVLLDDDALKGGNPGGNGDDVDAANTTGTLTASGGDGALTWSLSTTGAPAGFTYVASGTGINVFQGAVQVLAITLNPATGAYVVTQVAPIVHPSGNTENNQVFTLTYTVTDADGDTASGTLGINVDDDTPIAANDTDTIAAGTYGPATGNVLTDASAGDTGDGDTGADRVGADGGLTLTAITGFGGAGAVNGTTTGQYGVLTLNADGSYSYVRNAGTAGGVSDVFTYTIRDTDGDTTTATLTISIADALPVTGENATALLDDDALAGGNAGGTGDDVDAANLTGTLSASGGDGPLTWALSTSGAPAGFSYVANGTGINVMQGSTLVMQVTLNAATGAYTVTQVAPIDHAAGADENNQIFAFGYTVTDQDGDAASGTLSVNVDDDTAVLVNDTDSIASGTYGPATGNVLTDAEADGGADSLGADGGTLTAITGFGGAGAINGTTTGEYGVLTLNGDGSYSYTRNAGTPGGVSDTFTYTVTDGDGDVATATLVITIEDARPLTGENATVLLDDDTQPGGNPGGTGDDPDTANLTGIVAASGGDGPLAYQLFGVSMPAGGFTSETPVAGTVIIKQGGVTVLTITLDAATGAYTVVQNAPIDHPAGGDENNLTFLINYRVLDQDGDSAIGSLSINIDDDTPVAVDDFDTILSGSTAAATGNVITDAEADGGADSVGADAPGAVTAITGFGGAGTVEGTTTGQYGVLTIHADGSYSYVRNAGTPGNVSDTFTYTLRDSDGDTTTATLTITIEDAAPFTTPNAVVLFDDDALAGGNPGGTGDNVDAANVSGTLSGAGGDGALTWTFGTGGAPVGFFYVANGTGINVFQGATLVLQVTLNVATGAYTATQVAPIDHVTGLDENNQAFILNYTVTDADGDPASGTLSIDVNDDSPLAANDSDTITSGTYGPATGNVITDAAPGDLGDGDTGADSAGADGGLLVTAITGFGGAGAINGTTTGEYGVLTLNGDGSYSYTRNAGTPGGVSDTFTYTVTDADGDTATATLTISIADALPVTAPNAIVQLDDDALAGGNPGGTGDDLDAVNTTGTLAGSGGDGPLTWGLTGISIPDLSFVPTVVNPGLIEVRQGGVLVLTVTLNTTTGAYTVTQLAPIDHPNSFLQPNAENNLQFSVNYQVTDQDGDFANGGFNIIVDDDTPVVAADTDSIASGTYGPATGNILTDTSAGDTGDTDTGADSMGADGGTLTAITGFGGAGAINGTTTGQYGVLTLNSDGSYSYVRNAGTPGGVSDTFTYTVTDGDGDTASTTLTISIADALPITGQNATVLLDDDALAGGNPDGTGDDLDAVATSGTLAASGGDGPLTWALSTGGALAGFSYVANGTGLNVMQGTTLVMQVTLNPATGAYTVTQIAPIVHAAGADENNQAFSFGYTVTDQDSDTASGTLLVSVDDDTPTAANDSDAVTEDGPLTADGNVFTGTGGSDVNATDGVADSIGADGPAAGGAVTAVAFGMTAGTVNVGLAGAYGMLTLGGNGAYSYVLTNGNVAVQALDSGETLTEIFTYTITDSDGDTATATLTITINGTNDAPVVSPAVTAVSEEGLALANADGSGSADTTNLAVRTGTITATDVDIEPLSFTLGTPATMLSSNGVAITWTGAGTGTLIGSAGVVEVIRVTIDSSGNYTVTLSDQIDHPVTGSEDDLDLVVPVNVSDGTATTPTTLTVSIEDDSPIALAGTTSGTVDEDGLTGGIAGGTGDVAGAALTASGSVTGLFSGGADAPLTYSFSTDTSGLPALSSGGTALTYGVAGNVITASAGANTVFTLTLNATTGVWDFVLVRPLDHPTANAENDIVLQFGSMVIATDADGDSTPATGNLTVTIDDDTPMANPDGATQTSENAPVTVDVFTNDQGGADGTLVSTVALVGGSLLNGIVPATGTLFNNGDGTFTYTPGAGETGTVTFQYTITDRDGDTAPATATITLLADSVPQVVNVIAAVDDDGLPGYNILSTVGDINANTGEPGATTSEAVYTGAIAVNFGSDTGTVSFSNLHGTTGMVGTEMVTYTWNAGLNLLTATGPRGVLFTVSLSPSGAYTVTLVDNVLHADDAAEDETSAPVVTLNYLAADSDGDSNATGTLAITFNDDAPTLGVVQNQQASNDPAQTPAVGTLHFASGADGAGSTMTITANMAGITSGGHAIVTQQVGNVLTGYADITGNGWTGDDTAVFTLTVNPTAGTSGQYVFDLIAPLDTTVTNVSVGSGSAFGSGPSNGIIVSDGTSGLQLAFVTGWRPTGGFTGGEEPAWLAGGIPDLTQQTDVNGSTSGWGLSNNNFDNGEFLRFDFGAVDDYDAGGAYVPPVTGPFANVTYASFSFFNFAGGDTVEFVAHFTDGTTTITQSYVLVGGTDPSTLTITAPAGYQIAWIDAYQSTGSIKLNLTDVGVSSTTVDQTIPFTLQLADGDGDATTTANFSVHIGTGLTPFTPIAPIALDLDGDGVEFAALAAGTTFDYNGDGQAEGTAWVGADDGLLALDANGSGSVDSGSEIVFGGGGLTDLEGVAANHDSNHDGVLDAQDAAFAQFGVWQDADSDGVSDAGEFRTLSELGITSISLTSDGQGYAAADGDVTVFGSGTYTRSDGSTGVLADAAFATGTAQRQAQSAELAALSAAATGLLAAMAIDHANPVALAGLREAVIEGDGGRSIRIALAELDDHGAEPAFAHASIAAAKGAAPVVGHGHDAAGDTASAQDELGKLADYGSGRTEMGGDADKSALFDFHDASHSAMDALLAVGEPAAGQMTAGQAQPAVAQALADATGNHTVDSIVDYFVADSAGETMTSQRDGDFALQGLLDVSVEGTGRAEGLGAGAPHFNLMQALDHEQAAALA